MSDDWLQYVPVDIEYRPTSEAANRAVALFKSMTSMADSVDADFHDDIAFVDPGSNWSGVECSACGADAKSWWQDAMSLAWKRVPIQLDAVAGCCGARVSLNELRYRWPAAFGRFVLRVMNPHVGQLTAAQERELAQCLGCELTKVWRHF
jgi:hypothetical protein